VHSLISGISGENNGAIAFHRALGFTKIATLPEGMGLSHFPDLEEWEGL